MNLDAKRGINTQARGEMLQIERIVDIALMEALEEAARKIFGDEKIKWEKDK